MLPRQTDSAEPLDHPVFERRRFRKVAMNIHADDAHVRSTCCLFLFPGAGGLHGNYGFALAAHSGKPQGRPYKGSGSQPMSLLGLPALTCSRRPASRMVSPYTNHCGCVEIGTSRAIMPDKGKVEGLVKYSRANFLTPVPHAPSIEALNARLNERCLARQNERVAWLTWMPSLSSSPWMRGRPERVSQAHLADQIADLGALARGRPRRRDRHRQ